MNDYCFVIQPFDDGGKFDKRYEEVYKKAIDKAGIEAYRIDKDPSTRNIEIEEKIASSKICFADITEDNPNVWYELGYAFARGKDVVMVSDSTRENSHLISTIKALLDINQNLVEILMNYRVRLKVN